MASLKLPRQLRLPVAATAPAEVIRICLGGQSRQLLHYWKRQHGFPASFRNGRETHYLVTDVERWLVSRGVTVERV